MEILYRATRQGFIQGGDTAFQKHSAAKAIFEALVQKPTRVTLLLVLTDIVLKPQE